MKRDPRCTEEAEKTMYGCCKDGIAKRLDEIDMLLEDEKQGIQRYPRDNISIIHAYYHANFQQEVYIMRAMYSLGMDIEEIELHFYNNVINWEKWNYQGYKGADYLEILWMVSLGILLEADSETMQRIAKLVLIPEGEDVVIDFLLSACDIGWTRNTNKYYKRNPYCLLKEIIETAKYDKESASKLLALYMEKSWFKGHYDVFGKNVHKEKGFQGCWSYETAAIAKILELDDSAIEKNLNYPYDLAHYKNEKKYHPTYCFSDNISGEKESYSDYENFVEQIIADYELLDDEKFYQKYQEILLIKEVWRNVEEYIKVKKSEKILGKLIVFGLVNKGAVLEMDYKDSPEDFLLGFVNEKLQNEYEQEPIEDIDYESEDDSNLDMHECVYVKKLAKKVHKVGYKLVWFYMDNDQYYVGVLPKEVTSKKKLFEVTMKYS